jgi:flagellin FlaB
MYSSRRVAVSVVLAALVVAAGCAAGPLSDATGADPTSSPSLDDVSFPPGTTNETVENGSALAAATTDALSSSGYVVELGASRSTPQQSRNSTFVVRRDAQTGELVKRSVSESGDESTRQFAYVNDSGTYQKRGTENPSYDVYPDQTSDDQATGEIASASETLVPMGDWTDPSIVSRDGETLLEYDLAGISADAEIVRSETVTDASGTLLVDQQGVVHRATVDVNQEVDGDTVEAEYTYRVRELGDVAVEKPDWVRNVDTADGPSRQSNRVTVVAGTGHVADGSVETVDVVVRPAAGASDIDLSKATVQWVGPDTATTLTHGDSPTADTFAVEAVKDQDGSVPVLNDHSDRFIVTLDATEVGSGLEAGEEVQLRITTQYGTETVYWANVPDDIAGESVVRL